MLGQLAEPDSVYRPVLANPGESENGATTLFECHRHETETTEVGRHHVARNNKTVTSARARAYQLAAVQSSSPNAEPIHHPRKARER